MSDMDHSGAIRKLAKRLAVKIPSDTIDKFLAAIERNPDQVRVLPFGLGRCIIWTKEEGVYKIVTWSGDRSLDERQRFWAWRNEVRAVFGRVGISISHAAYSNSSEVIAARDPDMSPPPTG